MAPRWSMHLSVMSNKRRCHYEVLSVSSLLVMAAVRGFDHAFCDVGKWILAEGVESGLDFEAALSDSRLLKWKSAPQVQTLCPRSQKDRLCLCMSFTALGRCTRRYCHSCGSSQEPLSRYERLCSQAERKESLLRQGFQVHRSQGGTAFQDRTLT